MIDWKEAARHYRFHMKLSEELEGRLKLRLGSERERRVRLVSTLSNILMDIAYEDDDPDQTYCNVCRRSLIEEDGHQPGCLYVVALDVLAEAGRSASE